MVTTRNRNSNVDGGRMADDQADTREMITAMQQRMDEMQRNYKRRTLPFGERRKESLQPPLCPIRSD